MDSILRIKPPKTVKNVREFTGMVNFIKNHIPNCAAIMAPITRLTKKDKPFVCEAEQDEAFLTMKARIADAILLTYPDPNKPFVIYPDASNKYAIGGMLAQDGKTVSTLLQKFNDAQLKYPVGEQELLAAHESARHFEKIVRGCELFIETDHKNNVYDGTKHTNM